MPVLVLSGTVGAGKTTVMLALHGVLSAWRVPHACVDRDSLAWSWPPDAPFNEGTVLRSLAALWSLHRAAGVERLVVAGVLESPAHRRAYVEALPGARVTVCRLVVPLAVREARVRARERGEALAWHLARTVELDAILDAAGVEDFVVENGHRPPEDVAREVLRAAGWDHQG